MTTALRRGDPGRPITIGLHMEDLENDRVIGPAEAARWCDVVSMHGYPIYARLGGGLDGQRAGAVPRRGHPLAGIRRAGALRGVRRPDRAARTPRSEGLLDEAAAAEYTGRVLDGLRAVGCRGAFLWCFSDYASDLSAVPPFDAAPHELGFGLWRADGTAKPAVSEVTSRAGAACVPPGSPGDWLDIDAARRSRRTGAITSGASTVASALRVADPRDPAAAEKGSRVVGSARVRYDERAARA